jgi:hypothetical protein
VATLLETALSFFERDGWPIWPLEDQTAFSTRYAGENGRFNCLARVREEQSQFLFYSTCPVNVPEDKRAAMAEFITRANYGLILGNFEMDYRDGEVRFKTSIDVEGGELTDGMLRNLTYANVLTMDRYLPGMMTLLYGDATPEEAIAKVEG